MLITKCNWDVTESAPPVASIRPTITNNSAASSIKSLRSTPVPSRSNSSNAVPTLATTKLEKPVRISYLTEQTSHHPPVSAFYVDCPAKGLSARGFDQISAKFTGTSIKVTPGEHNYGIFINVDRHGEHYQLTHPAAHLGGLLRGSLNVTVTDQCLITCAETKIKAILHYIEEGWLGKTQNKVEGVIFRYDPENDDKVKIKDVPEKDILARINGNWKDKLYFTLGPNSRVSRTLIRGNVANNVQDQALLMDLAPLSVAPKIIPATSEQQPNESLRFWGRLTEAIEAKQFSKATQVKQELEDGQRKKAKKREEEKREWRPRFYTGAVTGQSGQKGIPELNESGKKLLANLQNGDWTIPEEVAKRIQTDE